MFNTHSTMMNSCFLAAQKVCLFCFCYSASSKSRRCPPPRARHPRIAHKPHNAKSPPLDGTGRPLRRAPGARAAAPIRGIALELGILAALASLHNTLFALHPQEGRSRRPRDGPPESP